MLTPEEKSILASKEGPQRKIYTKICAICKNTFDTETKSKNICSFICKQEHNRQHARYYMRMKRFKKPTAPCEICGFKETTDIHRERGHMIILCPNHHALITRGIKTLEQLKEAKSV